MTARREQISNMLKEFDDEEEDGGRVLGTASPIEKRKLSGNGLHNVRVNDSGSRNTHNRRKSPQTSSTGLTESYHRKHHSDLKDEPKPHRNSPPIIRSTALSPPPPPPAVPVVTEVEEKKEELKEGNITPGAVVTEPATVQEPSPPPPKAVVKPPPTVSKDETKSSVVPLPPQIAKVLKRKIRIVLYIVSNESFR